MLSALLAAALVIAPSVPPVSTAAQCTARGDIVTCPRADFDLLVRAAIDWRLEADLAAARVAEADALRESARREHAAIEAALRAEVEEIKRAPSRTGWPVVLAVGAGGVVVGIVAGVLLVARVAP